MSGPLESMASMKEANCEAEMKQRMQSLELWRRLDLYRLALLSSKSRETTTDGGATERKLALGLLKDVEPRLLFLAVDFSYGQTGDEVKRRAVETALLSVFGSTVGPEIFQQNGTELVAFFLAGLCHPAAGVRTLTATAMGALGLGSSSSTTTTGEGQSEEEGRERADRCRTLLQPPLLPALVAALGDGDTGTSQARNWLLSLLGLLPLPGKRREDRGADLFFLVFR
ncbi:unnamed protein product [Ectocarpus sp. 8 AP-2014]